MVEGCMFAEIISLILNVLFSLRLLGWLKKNVSSLYVYVLFSVRFCVRLVAAFV